MRGAAWAWLFLIVVAGADATPAQAQAAGPAAPVMARHGIVASQEARATHIGVAVLEKGGNAVDAAVAVGFALAVTHPQAGNIGGGGFMVIHLAGRNEQVAIEEAEYATVTAMNTPRGPTSRHNADRLRWKLPREMRSSKQLRAR